jgi:excisionase family DNA binding protein
VPQDWLSPSEAARNLNISSEQVRKLMRQGKLTYIWTSLGRLIQPESIDAFKSTWIPRSNAGRKAVATNG